MSKVYLEFKNAGEIDINALRLLGASSKETDNTKIGFWGTGLKYSIAVLLRESIDIKVFSGLKEIKIGKRKTKMRGDTYEVMTVNGTPTSVTTRMGKDWEPWFAVRELYANMKDEGNEKIEVTDSPQGLKGTTRIFIEFNDSMKAIFDNLPEYFSFNREVKYEAGLDKLYKRHKKDAGILYRRGFKIGEQKGTLFDYDLHDIQINETRTVKYNFQVSEYIGKLWRTYSSLEGLRRLINTRNWERDELDWEYSDGVVLNQNWLEALKGTVIIPAEATGFFVDDLSEPHYILPSKLCRELNKQFGDQLKIRGFNNGKQTNHKVVEPQKHELEMIGAVVIKMGIVFPDISDIPFEIAVMQGKILGTVNNGVIVLNRNLFNMGEHELMKTVIEEYIHIKTDAEDRTREFQDYATHCVATAINRAYERGQKTS